MSQFSIQKKLIQPKLSLCNQICSKKDPVEVYTHTKIELKSGILFISALNSGLFYQTNVAVASSTSDCEFAIKTDMFYAAVDLVIGEDISFTFDKDKQSLTIKGTKGKHVLRTNPTIIKDFISPTQNSDQLKVKVELPTTKLVEAVDMAMIAVGNPKNTYQPEFCNICFSAIPNGNKLAIVSTDRFRISKVLPAEAKVTFNENNSVFEDGQNQAFLLPPKTLKLALNSIDSSENVEICFENDFAWFVAGSTIVTVGYGQGNYPDYNKIIPESFGCTFLVNPKEFAEGLKQVSLIGNLDAVNHRVKIVVNPEAKEITLTASSTDGEESESKVALSSYEGVNEPWDQAFNAGYLNDYLTRVNCETIRWESNPGKPSILSPEGKKDNELYLVSGLR